MGNFIAQKNGHRNLLLLMRSLYSIGISFYTILIRIAAYANTKAGKLIKGRKGWKKELTKIPSDKKVFFFFFSSLGEFEQGRPLIEKIKNKHPEIFILLTFYSPSGYEIRKNYKNADLIMYLPPDTKKNACYFIKHAHPTLAVFIKYEFWYNFIFYAKKEGVKLYSIATLFRNGQIFFKPWGKWFRKHLQYFEHFYAQNEQTALIAEKHDLKKITIAGDTRFDRVAEIASQNEEIDLVKEFAANHFTVIAGSSWPAEHNLLAKLCNHGPDDIKYIIAPHELNEKQYELLEKNIEAKVTRLSQVSETQVKHARVLIIDSIGLLSRLYRYGNVALIGGGFGKGIHNVLEPAVYGLPVIFGPEYKKFHEAVTMVAQKIAFPINNYQQLETIIGKLYHNKEYLREKSTQTRLFVEHQLGATDLILQEIEKQIVNQ